MILQCVSKIKDRLTYLRALESATHIEGVIPEAVIIDVSVDVSALLVKLHFLFLLDHFCE
jgi:hypothetical protein